MTIKQALSRIIQFPTKSSSSQAELDHALLHDLASKLAVLTGYLGARDGLKEREVIEKMAQELESRGGRFSDRPEAVVSVKTGFRLYQNNPGLSPEEVFNQS